MSVGSHGYLLLYLSNLSLCCIMQTGRIRCMAEDVDFGQVFGKRFLRASL